MMGKLVVMSFIRKDYHYVLINSVSRRCWNRPETTYRALKQVWELLCTWS
jgi:hypothetical protein